MSNKHIMILCGVIAFMASLASLIVVVVVFNTAVPNSGYLLFLLGMVGYIAQETNSIFETKALIEKLKDEMRKNGLPPKGS